MSSYQRFIVTISCTVPEIQRDIGRKSPFKTTPPLFGALVGVTSWNFAQIFGVRKRVPGLSYGVVCVILHLAVLIQYRRVTDRETDGRTDGHMTTAYTALAQRRAVKTNFETANITFRPTICVSSRLIGRQITQRYLLSIRDIDLQFSDVLQK